MDVSKSAISRRQMMKISAAALASTCIVEGFPKFFSPKNIWAAETAKRYLPEPTTNELYYIGDDNWLKLTFEQALEPDMPICDPHHHLWPGFQAEQFLSEMSGGHNILKTVFVESMRNKSESIGMQPVEETEFVVNEGTKIKSRTEIAAGIVGSADLMLGDDVAPILEGHVKAGRGRFRGIRMNNADVTTDSKFREGYANLGKFDLSLDTFLSYSKFNELIDLSRTFPDTPIIINHIGRTEGIGAGDDNSEKITKEWKVQMKALSACKNVYVKLGGIGMTHYGFDWYKLPAPPDSMLMAKAMAPYFDYCVEQFGADRCMFESNWPVDRVSSSYTILWNAFKRYTKDFSKSERSALFYDTAVKVYRLG